MSSTDSLDYVNCHCVAGGPVLTGRMARSGRAFHNNIVGGSLVLIASSKPRVWSAFVAQPGTSWRKASFNSAKLSAYHIANQGLKKALPRPDISYLESLIMEEVSDPMERADVLAVVVEQYRLSTLGTGEDAFIDEEPILDEAPVERGTYTPRAKKMDSSASTFTPPPVNPDLYWYEAARDAKLLLDFEALRLKGHATNLMIVGPSGFGKTRGIIRFGEKRGVPVHIVNCQAITTPEKWIGQMMVHPEKGTYFEVSNHIQWVERTHPDCEGSDHCIILYDEITRLRPELANMQFSLLDEQQGLEVPQMGRRVKMSDKNVIIATANIGTPYAGTFTMDWALRGRFDMNLERGIPPEDEERKVLTSATGITDEQANMLVRVANHTRKLWQNGELESPISTRSLVSWARLVGGGYTIKDAADYTIIPLYNEDGGVESDRAKVKQAVDGKTL